MSISLVRRAVKFVTLQNLPTQEETIFKFFLKSVNLKLFIASQNIHSFITLTLLIELLKSFCYLSTIVWC